MDIGEETGPQLSTQLSLGITKPYQWEPGPGRKQGPTRWPKLWAMSVCSGTNWYKNTDLWDKPSGWEKTLELFPGEAADMRLKQCEVMGNSAYWDRVGTETEELEKEGDDKQVSAYYAHNYFPQGHSKTRITALQLCTFYLSTLEYVRCEDCEGV